MSKLSPPIGSWHRSGLPLTELTDDPQFGRLSDRAPASTMHRGGVGLIRFSVSVGF
jgi:hypothetical protein